jgi:alkylation response protein AidB-like acyl-CoA dehydrogenase
MASTAAGLPPVRGGAFLIEERAPEEIFSPEDFTEEHRAIARTADEFWKNEVATKIEAIQQHEHGVAVALLRKAGELGLTSPTVPEIYGGMELGLIPLLIVAERFGRDGSFAAWYGAHAGIGTFPLLLFGTAEQKRRYLPKVASAEMVAAYCLSEAHAGSDALAARTRADLAEDGSHYILTGQKMWITNAAGADIFTVFAKTGEKLSAFLVERGWPGVSIGAEEKKMGIQGSSTCAVYFDSVRVPAENLLGEQGRGHVLAFNILNLGRMKLGAFAVGGMKDVLALSARYAKERKAFGKRIAEFGLIRHKLAEMAIRTWVTESVVYRTGGLIESRLAGIAWDQPEASATAVKAVEEYATECSFVKVFASEALDYVVDEGVQIHGGYGYHRDYAVERAYRDSRINRIFEGTNEINRLLATGMMLRRAQRGQLPLVEAVKKTQAEALAGPPAETGDAQARLVANAKKIGLLVMGAAYQRYLNALEDEQEVLAGITDILMQAFAMESAWLRANKPGARGEQAAGITDVFLREGITDIERTARGVLAACSEGDALRTQLAVLRRFAKFEPVNAVALRRRIADRVLQNA